MAPAEVPEIASIRSHGSSSRRSRTPQVNAPWEPPPCNAKSMRTGARFTPGLEDVFGIGLHGFHGALLGRRCDKPRPSLSPKASRMLNVGKRLTGMLRRSPPGDGQVAHVEAPTYKDGCRAPRRHELNLNQLSAKGDSKIGRAHV